MTEDIRNDVVRRLKAIKTYGDYAHVFSKMGPFEFTEECPSTTSAAELLTTVWKFFFGGR